MDKVKLKYFISAASHLSFTKAAEDCHVVQGTISKQIASIEEELGVRLFIRKGQTLELTPAGAQLMRDSNDYMEQYLAIENSLSRLHLLYSDSLRLAVGTMEHPLITAPMTYFHNNHPDINLLFSTYTYARMAAHFRNGTLDIGICCNTCADTIVGMGKIPVSSGSWLICAPHDSPFWDKSPDDRAHLRAQNIISVPGSNDYDTVMHHLNSGDFEHKSFTHTNALISLLALVESGYGIGILPPFYKDKYPELRKEVMTYNPITTGFSCVYNPRKANIATIEMFLEYYDKSQSV